MRSPIRIEAPDAATASTLVHEADGLYEATLGELDDGRWEVRLQREGGESRLVVDALTTVGRWLTNSGLPWTRVDVDGRSYRIEATPRPPAPH